MQELNPIQSTLDDTAQLQHIAETAYEVLDSILPDTNPKSGAFTSEEEQALIAYWNEHLNVREIANLLNRSFNSTRNKVAQLQKKGAIRKRDEKSKLPDNFIETISGAYNLPIDLVAYFVTLFNGTTDLVMENVEKACGAYIAQKGYCYYLQGKVMLTQDNSPSGIVVSNIGSEMILICRAVAGMRMTMTHNTFVEVCRHVANHSS